jgi:hypothetical protein
MEILITLAFEFLGDTGLSREGLGRLYAKKNNMLFKESVNVRIV